MRSAGDGAGARRAGLPGPSPGCVAPRRRGAALSTPGMGDRLGVKVPGGRGGANSEPEATASS